MKRVFLLCMSFLLLFCGCAAAGTREKEEFLRLRTELIAREEVFLRAEVTADYGERVYIYLLQYQGSDSRGRISVEEPAEIRDVEAVLEEGQVALHYDGAVLDTGAVVGPYSPLQIFPLLVQTWKSGSVRECWREALEGADCIAVLFDLTQAGEDTTLCRSWFDRESLQPLCAELETDGRTVLRCRFFPEAAPEGR